MLARAYAAPALLCLLLLAPLATSCGGPTVELVDDTLDVVHVSPSHGSIEVRRDATITIGFSSPVDESSLGENLLVISEDSGGGTKAVEHRVFLDETGKVVTVVPDNVLDPRTLHRVILSEGLRANSGALMNAAFRSEFMTGE